MTATATVFPYQQIDGLKAIYVGLGQPPAASFVFETAEKMQEAAKSVKIVMGYASDVCRTLQFQDKTRTDLLEIRTASNLSPVKDEERILSYSAIPSGIGGKPIESAHELLEKLGKAMALGSMPIKVVPIYGVDSKY